MAVGPVLGKRALLADEGVVGRRLAVARDADDLADVRAEVLREVALRVALPRRHEQVPVRCEHEPRAEVMVARELGLLAEDHGHVRETVIGEARPRDGRSVLFALAGLGIRKVDDAVIGESGIEGDVEQPPLADGGDLGHACDGLREFSLFAHVAEPAGPLRHEHPAVGKERNSPGMLEPARDRCHGYARLGRRGGVPRRLLAGRWHRDQGRQQERTGCEVGLNHVAVSS
jgi:hypothetical protein